MDDLRKAIVAHARAELGTPFMHQGRLPRFALDCVGLVVVTALACGLAPAGFDFNGYPPSPDGRTLLHECDRRMTRIQPSDMRPGDVIVVRWARDPQHLGILGDYPKGGLSMIHALGTSDGKGSVVEHRLDPTMLARLVAAYRLPGVSA